MALDPNTIAEVRAAVHDARIEIQDCSCQICKSKKPHFKDEPGIIAGQKAVADVFAKWRARILQALADNPPPTTVVKGLKRRYKAIVAKALRFARIAKDDDDELGDDEDMRFDVERILKQAFPDKEEAIAELMDAGLVAGFEGLDAGIERAATMLELDPEDVIGALQQPLRYSMEQTAYKYAQSTLERIDTNIKEMLVEGLNEGLPPAKMGEQIEEQFSGLEDWEALRIARTEFARGQSKGILGSMKDQGQTLVRWLATPDCCEVCAGYADRIWPIDMVGDALPCHPHDRCTWDVVYELADDEEVETEPPTNVFDDPELAKDPWPTLEEERAAAKAEQIGKDAAFESSHPRGEAGRFAPKSARPQTALTPDERAAKISNLKALRAQYEPLAQKGNLTRSEAEQFVRLTNEANALRFDLAKPLELSDIPSPGERQSTLPSDVVLIARNDLLRHKVAYMPITEAASGVSFAADTAVDRVMNGEDPNITPREFYDTFSDTRQALRSHYGDTVHLFRAVGQQQEKPTQNWATTREYASQFGSKIVERDVPVDDVIAVNVGISGKYHELIVGDHLPVVIGKDAEFESKHARDGSGRFLGFYKGDCFGNAIKYATRNKLPEDARIVHGHVTNASGKRLAHAWIETGAKVIDPTQGVEMDRAKWYELVSAKADAKYAEREAVRTAISSGHKGPWREDELAKAWDESKHPRGEAGRFAEVAGGGQTETPEFKAWFAESKIVDHDGAPMVMYHGTAKAGFSQFKDGVNYFTSNPAYANNYTKPSYSAMVKPEAWHKAKDAPAVLPVYLKIQKPFDTRDDRAREIFQNEFYANGSENWQSNGTPLDGDTGLPDWTDAEDLHAFLKEKGYDYDGLVLSESGGNGNVTFATFEPSQIKSALGNRGTFDPHDADITKSDAELIAKYSDAQPRDDHGRWTGGGGEALPDKPRGVSPLAGVAFQHKGKIYRGEWDDIHATLFSKLPEMDPELTDDDYDAIAEGYDTKQGFVDRDGDFHSRAEVMQRLGVNQSEDLRASGVLSKTLDERELIAKYNELQARDECGRWTSGSISGANGNPWSGHVAGQFLSDDNGPITFYHGTSSETPEQLRGPVWLTTSHALAERYAGKSITTVPEVRAYHVRAEAPLHDIAAAQRMTHTHNIGEQVPWDLKDHDVVSLYMQSGKMNVCVKEGSQLVRIHSEIAKRNPVSLSASCVMAMIGQRDAKAFLDFGGQLPGASLYTGEAGADSYGPDYGLEREPHLTILYGLQTDDPQQVKKLTDKFGPFTVVCGRLACFPAEDRGKPYDVLYVPAYSGTARKMNRRLKSLPYQNDYDGWTGHITIAYLKPGKAARYVGDDQFAGKQLRIDTLCFSCPDGSKAMLPLGDPVEKVFDPAQPRDEDGKWTDAGVGGSSAPITVPTEPRSFNGWESVIDSKPRTLYRSISPEEYEDFQRTGKITGKGNEFNEFDTRKGEVFFADKLSKMLLYQGQDASRVAFNNVIERPQYQQQKKDDQEYARLRAEIQRAVEVANIRRRADGKPLIDVSQKRGQVVTRDLNMPVRGESRLKELAVKFKQYSDGYDKAVESFRSDYKEEYRRLSSQPRQSYLIETHPIIGGRVYEKAFNQNEGLDEIGFDAGQITREMVKQIYRIDGEKLVPLGHKQ